MDFYTDILAVLKGEGKGEESVLFSAKEWARIKRELAQKHKLKRIPTNIQILLHIPEEDIPLLRSKLLTKPVRTASGVSPVAIMTRPARCPHGKCTFCPGGIGSPYGDVPQSYTGNEPATMRGIRNDYDAYLQVFNRLEQYVLLGQTFDKIEIIVMGGTFPAEDEKYQEEFIYGTFKALNDFSELFVLGDGSFDYKKFKEVFRLPGEMHDASRAAAIKKFLLDYKNRSETTVLEEQRRNECVSAVKCVALCIETKPDWGFLAHGNRMLEQGCTRVELGIQSVYDDVLKVVHRGHDSADSKKSVQILRDLGFKINFHYMPGLPLTDYERDMEGMKQLFTDPGYKPDMIKLYPCMVAPGTALFQQYKAGTFTPIGTEEAARRISEFYSFVPEYCRIQRVQRDVPTKFWEAGVDRTNLRQYVDEKHSGEREKLRDIRAREPRGREVAWDKVELKVFEYEASGSKEYFISAEDVQNDLLIGFCRLRLVKECLRKEIVEGSAMVRELHVYGTATAIGDEAAFDGAQHRGWGKKLIAKAEEIAKGAGKKKLLVISGVGVRGYYHKLGFVNDGPYVSKILSLGKEVF